MPYIIDGNNLIGCSPDIALNEPDSREKLIALVRKFYESKQTKVTIVFDGSPQSGLFRNTITPKFTIVYPTPGHSADDEIKKILKGYHHSNEVIVVTSDRELKNFAREIGAKTKNSIEFYYELKKACYQQGKQEETQKRIHASLSANEVDNWLKIFGNE